MATIQPITPQEVVAKKLEQIPDVVIQVFNNLIAKNFNGSEAKIKQNDVIDAIRTEDETISKSMIFDNHWLDVEDIYRKLGWTVEYDKPAYNEDYAPHFIFTFKK
jgi:hypothetical protein